MAGIETGSVIAMRAGRKIAVSVVHDPRESRRAVRVRPARRSPKIANRLNV